MPVVEQRMTAEPRCWGGVSHPSQLTTGLVIKSVTTSPTLAGERMLFILQVSILSEQMKSTICTDMRKRVQTFERSQVGRSHFERSQVGRSHFERSQFERS